MTFSRLVVPALSSLCMGYLACSASPPADLGNPGPGEGGSGGTGGSNNGGTGLIIGTGGGGTSGTGGECARAEAMAELVTEPVDIILLLDNSGSMDDELDAVERNINVNFAQILTDSMVDYRVILISRHRKAARDANAEASTSICVEAPTFPWWAGWTWPGLFAGTRGITPEHRDGSLNTLVPRRCWRRWSQGRGWWKRRIRRRSGCRRR